MATVPRIHCVVLPGRPAAWRYKETRRDAAVNLLFLPVKTAEEGFILRLADSLIPPGRLYHLPRLFYWRDRHCRSCPGAVR